MRDLNPQPDLWKRPALPIELMSHCGGGNCIQHRVSGYEPDSALLLTAPRLKLYLTTPSHFVKRLISSVLKIFVCVAASCKTFTDFSSAMIRESLALDEECLTEWILCFIILL